MTEDNENNHISQMQMVVHFIIDSSIQFTNGTFFFKCVQCMHSSQFISNETRTQENQQRPKKPYRKSD